MDPQELISGLNRVARIHFNDETISLYAKDFLNYYFVSSNNSLALNRHNSDTDQIKASKFVDDIWVYIVIRFKYFKKAEIQSFSLSAFKGIREDNFKEQIFRAEWDNFQDELSHPQPHWHFYSNADIEYLKKQFSEITNETQKGFLSELAEESNNKMIYYPKLHFAMGSQWQHQKGHKILFEDGDSFIDWFDGLLEHLKTEIVYSL
jgi:hypothetical protein